MYDGFRSHWHTLISSFVRFTKHATKKIIVHIIFVPKNFRSSLSSFNFVVEEKSFEQGNRREMLSSGIWIWAYITLSPTRGTTFLSLWIYLIAHVLTAVCKFISFRIIRLGLRTRRIPAVMSGTSHFPPSGLESGYEITAGFAFPFIIW